MKLDRVVSMSAMGIGVWFWAVYLVMSSLRDDYSHATKAVSELGSLDAPNLWVWNVLGFIVSGVVVAALGWRLDRAVGGGRAARIASIGLVASGLLMSVSGVFPGDFEDRGSFTMIMHAVGSLGSFLGFLVAGFVYPLVFRRLEGWRSVTWVSLALVVVSIATGFLRTGDAPGIGQRLGILCYFLWIGLVGFALLRDGVRRARAA